MPGIYSVHDAIIGVQSALGGRGGGLRYLLRDEFTTDRAAGAVTGTAAEPGPGTRSVVDTQSVVQIVGDGLHIGHTATAGWQVRGIDYQIARVPGLAVLLHVVDGDVQAGSQNAPHIAAGVFTAHNPADPTANGYVFGVDANGTNGGRSWINLAGSLVKQFASIKQVELLLLVVLRSPGAAYYIASNDGARGIGTQAYPNFRPIGLNLAGSDGTLYPGVYVKNSGSAYCNTRLYLAQSEKIDAWARWYGAASAADQLSGAGASISGVAADVGGNWSLPTGTMTVETAGAIGGAGISVAVLSNAATQGLIRARIVTGTTHKMTGVVFRYQDASNYWWAGCDATIGTLKKVVGGSETTISSTGAVKLANNTTHELQVIDDGTEIHAYFDGVQFPGTGNSDTALASATGAGIRFNTGAGGGDMHITEFESHPRAVALPAVLQNSAPNDLAGGTAVATEDFTGAAADLDGKTTTTGSLTWRKESGSGDIDLDGSGAALVDPANIAVAMYTIPWTDTNFADIEVVHTPPGSGYGSGDNGFAGLLFWQDASNYLILRTFIDDSQTNAAEYEIILSVGGSGGVTNRVNFGTEIAHGVAHTLRMVFDGNRFVAYKNGEPVISSELMAINASYSALTINRVGLYAAATNTGSLFDDFVAKSE